MHHTRSAALVITIIGLLGGAFAEGAGPDKEPAAAHDKAKGSQGQPAAEVVPAAVSRSEPGSSSAAAEVTEQPPPKPAVQAAEPRKVSTASSPLIASNAPTSGKAALAVRNEAADPLALNVLDVLADDELAEQRGGSETHNQNTSTGGVTDNVASQLTTGSNTLSESAFSNSSGIPIVIQNSGNNVLIQNSTILNLQLTSPSK